MSPSHRSSRVLVCLLLCLAAVAAPAAAQELSSRLTVETASLTAGAAPSVNLTLTNDSSRDIQVLRWQTLVDGVKDDLFAVTRNGVAVRYIGPVYKRPAPQASDYVRIEAGQSLSASVDLSQYYEMTVRGSYTVQFRATLAAVNRGGMVASSTTAGLAVESNAVTITLDQVPAPAAVPGGIEVQSVAPGFRSCSASQQSQIRAAVPAAETYAANAASFLASLPTSQRSTNARYRTWFGAYTASRYSTVQNHFNRIRNALTSQRFVLDCSCREGAYAYVFPNRPYEVFLCNAFWPAPLRGTDSKAGTLVHEASHFNVLGGTDDHAYGHSACMNLARTSPSRAVNNADSHEYFAENTPPR